jgi:hypothetical protein
LQRVIAGREKVFCKKTETRKPQTLKANNLTRRQFATKLNSRKTSKKPIKTTGFVSLIFFLIG